MIIIQLMGGMGNQMFQYAFGRQLEELGQGSLKLDLEYLLDRTPRENFTFRDYDLDIFNINPSFAPPATRRDFDPPAGRLDTLIHTVKNKIKPRHLVEEKFYHFDADLLKKFPAGDVYLVGYWQTPRYFKDIENTIRKEFTFKNPFDEKTALLAAQIRSANAVCLNVRRGDFVSNPLTNQFHGTIGLDYYSKAVNYMGEKLTDPHFFIFSDDVEWCRENIKTAGFPATLVGHEYKGNKFEFYLHLMTLCKHFIIPNSTFAWWAAWLSNSPGKTVIAPKQFYRDTSINTTDLIPSEWVRL